MVQRKLSKEQSVQVSDTTKADSCTAVKFKIIINTNRRTKVIKKRTLIKTT